MNYQLKNTTTMKKIFTIIQVLIFSVSLSGQIVYQGCTNLITTGPPSYTLSQSGTTNDGGTIRNSYAAPVVSCSAGVCNFTMIWNTGAQRWEFSLPGTGVLHHNSSASAPTPPDLTLGTWSNGFGCSDISMLSGDVQSSISLPVELVFFNLKNDLKHIVLNWQTASEINNAGFEIQRGTDGKTFQNLTFIEGNGTTQKQQNYIYNDRNLQQGQIYYYRLKQIDSDGKFEYSEVITAQTKGQEITGTFAPNPASVSHTILNYHTPEDGELSFQLFDVSGQKVMQKNYFVNVGGNQMDLDLSQLRKGMFFAKMQQGTRVVYERLIVK